MPWCSATRLRCGWSRKRVVSEPQPFSRLWLRQRNKAIEEHQDIHFDGNWWEPTYDDVKRVAEAMGIGSFSIDGFDLDRGRSVDMSGTWLLQPGCIERVKDYAPQDKELHRIIETFASQQITFQFLFEQSFEVKFKFSERRSGKELEVTGSDDEEPYYGQEANAVETLVTAFRDWILDQLDAEMEHLSSPETIAETLTINGYKFDRSGAIV